MWTFGSRNRDVAARLEALDRSHAVIEFDLNGKILSANQNFLDTVGYRLEEIIGQSHSMFVDREYAASDEYAAFWRTLNDGRYHTGAFRRVGKDGREIWIEATYNPVLGRNGRPVRVVKFASDVTAERMRLADLSGQVAAINNSQAVIEFDLKGNILAATTSSCRRWAIPLTRSRAATTHLRRRGPADEH